MRWVLFVLLAAAAVTYAFWVYLRVDLAVPISRRLALLRSISLVVVLLLLFDARIPLSGRGVTDWVLLDASLSMGARGGDGSSAWDAASARARALESDGWAVVTFGDDAGGAPAADGAAPTHPRTRLAPALERAAESGARRVVVLSDMRFEDGVALRAALDGLPLEVTFEPFGETLANAGVLGLDVPDFGLSDEPVVAEIEVHGRGSADSLTVEVRAEDEVVGSVRVRTPGPGLRTRATLELRPPAAGDRVRYTASVVGPGDAFVDDDRAVAYAALGREEGGLVLVSLTPDWEPRYLLPVLAELTGLPSVGYLRAGADRFVIAGRAVDRGEPVDSAAVRRAVGEAAIVVVHGLGAGLDPWAEALARRPGRKILTVLDPTGARLAGIDAEASGAGEWYASADIPTSPIAGTLVGVSLQGLPPLGDVLRVQPTEGSAPLLVQLRGAGAPEPALVLAERPDGRTAVVLASGFWRWASRPAGREPYRRLWSGVAGWLLADQTVTAAEARPTRWVVPRGEAVTWSVPPDSAGARIVVRSDAGTVLDTIVVGGGTRATGELPPGPYAYSVVRASGDTIGAGRFDVAATTEEMLPTADVPVAASGGGSAEASAGAGVPLRTTPWPYLLVLLLLCAEWVARRRAGLR